MIFPMVRLRERSSRSDQRTMAFTNASAQFQRARNLITTGPLSRSEPERFGNEFENFERARRGVRRAAGAQGAAAGAAGAAFASAGGAAAAALSSVFFLVRSSARLGTSSRNRPGTT